MGYQASESLRLRGYLWLALDTPEAADHLVDYYERQGFSIKETLQFADRPYRSVVFSKSVAYRKMANHQPHALGGHPLCSREDGGSC